MNNSKGNFKDTKGKLRLPTFVIASHCRTCILFFMREIDKKKSFFSESFTRALIFLKIMNFEIDTSLNTLKACVLHNAVLVKFVAPPIQSVHQRDC